MSSSSRDAPNDVGALTGVGGPRGTGVQTVDAKRALRAEMRALRRGLEHRPSRSERIWFRLLERHDVQRARRMLIFESIPGEPETDVLRAMLHDSDVLSGVELAVPEDDGLQPSWPDVIIVPGLAFTSDGHRLGQGGGWYDRFLVGRRASCPAIGVCFDVQLLDRLPTEPHDVVLDAVVTDG